MPHLDLRLFGVPRLFLDGEEIVISRPRVFECLARIILEGPDGITRSELCRKIWPEFDQSDARAQLRGTLMKLRAELEKAAIAHQFELGGESVRAIGSVSCDLISFTAEPLGDWADIRTAVQPVAKSWEEENWREESDRVAEALATSLDRMKAKDACLAVDLLRKAVHSHPTSTRLVNLLVRKLENLGRVDEANQVIIAFEDAWVDRFGNVDLPRITINPDIASQTLPTKSNRHFRSVGIALAGFVWIASIVGVPLGMQLLHHQSTRSSDLKIVSRQAKTLNGHTLEVIELATGDSRIEGLTRLSDGSVVIRSSKDHSERQDVINPNGAVTPGPMFPAILKDRVGGSSLVSDNSYLAHWNQEQQTIRLQGTSELPFFDPVCFLGDRRVLGVRVSDDPFRSHSATLIADVNGVDTLRPTNSITQTMVPTYVDQDHIFLTYSGGRSEGWKYHGAEYAIGSKAFKSLPYPHVAYESSKGTLVVLPEVTSVKNGDYDTHWDGRVLIVRSGHLPEEVSVQGVNQFESASCFEDSLILQTSHTSGFRNVQVIPIEGAKASFTMPSRVADVFVSAGGKALIYREFDSHQESSRYVLMGDM